MDRFGHLMQMHYEGESTFNTVYGAIITIAVYALILVNTLNIGTDFIRN